VLTRVCIMCSRPAIPGGSRCPEHRRGNWDRRRTPPGTYSDPLYLKNRAKILAPKPICHWCGQRPAPTADHLKAVAEGGGHELENLVPACERCNRLRGASLGGRNRKLRAPPER
jgi:5-methylcytosine-specific restriction endonuclease McrA